jgi:hypothetical protein
MYHVLCWICNFFVLSRFVNHKALLGSEVPPLIIAKQESPHYELLYQTASQQQRILLISLSKDADVKPFSK